MQQHRVYFAFRSRMTESLHTHKWRKNEKIDRVSHNHQQYLVSAVTLHEKQKHDAIQKIKFLSEKCITIQRETAFRVSFLTFHYTFSSFSSRFVNIPNEKLNWLKKCLIHSIHICTFIVFGCNCMGWRLRTAREKRNARKNRRKNNNAALWLNIIFLE